MKLHESLFGLVYGGRFAYESVYEMPVQYRNFYIKQFINVREKEQSDMNKAQGKMSGPSQKVVKGPGVYPK